MSDFERRVSVGSVVDETGVVIIPEARLEYIFLKIDLSQPTPSGGSLDDDPVGAGRVSDP